MSHRGLSAIERQWVASGPKHLARIATTDTDGLPHVVPGQWAWDSSQEVFVLGGRDVPSTRRWKNVESTGKAALVIDGVDTSSGWAPWGLMAGGEALADVEQGAILVAPDEVSSWGLQSRI